MTPIFMLTELLVCSAREGTVERVCVCTARLDRS